MTNERCAEILQNIKFMLSSEQYSDEVEEALDKAIKAMGQPKAKMFKVPYGQDPYNAIGEYISNHMTVIEDIIAVIEIDGSIINTLFSVDIDEYGYFTWYTDWYEGEKNVALIDFFPVSEATRPIAQQDFDIDQKINKAYDDGYDQGYLQCKAEQEREPAHWVLLDECSNSGYYCSKCHKKVIKEGWSSTVKKIKFCPNCGLPIEGVVYEI